ncbi:MAG: hypothetical protein KA035_01855 [Candidatus Levybacteria bacterium]|nr:hypothetical protein [Candidatus Levybacteria bacterium]
MKKYILLLCIIFGLFFAFSKTSFSATIYSYCGSINNVCETESCTEEDGNLCGDWTNCMLCGDLTCIQTGTAPNSSAYCGTPGGQCGDVCDGSYGSCAQGACTQQGAGSSSICVCNSGGGGSGPNCSSGFTACGSECCNNSTQVCLSSGVCSTPYTPPPDNTVDGRVYVDTNKNGNFEGTEPLRSTTGSNTICGPSGSTNYCTHEGYYQYSSSGLTLVYTDTQECRRCFLDQNGNGLLDQEYPVAGVIVSASGNGPKTTYSNGTYGPFTYTSTGTYTLSINTPVGYVVNGGSPKSVTANSLNNNYEVDFGYITAPPSCSSLTKNSRAGDGGIDPSGTVLPGQTIDLFANIINDDGNHSDWDWNATCGTFTVDQWDYATWSPPNTASGNCNITYSLNGQNQAACNATFIVPTVSIQGRHVQANGTTLAPPPTGTSVSIAGPQEGGSTIQSSNSNPWSFPSIWTGTYSITTTTHTAYGISYKCNSGVCGSLLPNTWYAGNTLTHTLPDAGSSADIHFRYIAHKTPPTPCLLSGAGDVNGDGYVTSTDSSLLMQYLVGSITLTPAQILRGDVVITSTPGITVSDISAINGYANGIITTFQVCTAATATPTLPSGVTATPTPTQSVCTGTTGPHTVSGNIYVDTAGDNCASGGTLYSDVPPNLTLQNNGAATAGPVTYNPSASSPRYILSNPASCSVGVKSVLMSGLPGAYLVRGIRTASSGPWTPLSGYTATLTTSSGTTTLDWCVSTASSWYQTDSGDVRYSTLTNRVPAGQKASTNPTSPGVFFSSDDIINSLTFGLGTISDTGWKVSDEYQYNDDFRNGLGGMSYTFYKSQARRLERSIAFLTPTGLASLGSRSTGIYEFVGDATINTTTIDAAPPGKHIILLVSGNATINGPITLPTGRGNLFVLAVKGNITINPTVGRVHTDTTSSLDGYYTAEGSIILPTGANCTAGTPDLRLNVSGALVANSLRPFATGGSGRIQNSRTLCGQNATYPALFVSSRPEFLTQLSDFYKTTYKTYREVSP